MRQTAGNRKDLGVLFILAAAVLYSIGGLCIKVIPWNGLAINGGRTMIALFVVSCYLAAIRHRPRLNRWILLGALCICGTNCLFTVSNKLTTAANAIVLQFTAPMFVVLLSALFLRRKPRRRDLVACGAVLLGVLCCCMDSMEAGSVVGDLLALASGVTYAVVFLLNELPDGDPISSVFWGNVMSAVVGLPFVLQETTFTPTTAISLVVLGVFQVAAAYICMTIGLKTTPPVTASLVSGIEPVLNPILVAVFYHETIGPLALLGAAIVIGTVLIYNVINTKQDMVKENISHDFV